MDLSSEGVVRMIILSALAFRSHRLIGNRPFRIHHPTTSHYDLAMPSHNSAIFDETSTKPTEDHAALMQLEKPSWGMRVIAKSRHMQARWYFTRILRVFSPPHSPKKHACLTPHLLF
jgi:hypothetical protein